MFSTPETSVHVRDKNREISPMTMTYISHSLSSRRGALTQLRSIKWSLSSHALNTLVAGFLHSRLDYYNVAFACLPACVVQRLQSVLNTAWSPAHRDVIIVLLCCVIVIDFLSSSAPSTSCVLSFIVASSSLLWSTSSRRQLLQVPQPVLDLPSS